MTDTASYKAFFEQIDLKQYKSVLCLNGDLPKASFFREMDLPIIAADGAANYLIKNDILPEVIIGDLDSIDRKQFKQFKQFKSLPFELFQLLETLRINFLK